MQNIAIDNKICVFLNHHKLIEDIYRQHSETNLGTYSLKQQLFNFKPKPAVVALETALSAKQIKNLNRKRKAETENDVTLKENFCLEPFLKEIQKQFLAPQESPEDVPRLWEEQQDFPQFRGANATNEFQITQFHKKDYVIPPKTKFFNYDIVNLSKLLPELETYDLLIMDMPWQNKYIKRLKKVKTSLAYQMLDNETLKKLPIPQLIHSNSLVVLWCTNALQHRQALEQEFLANWNLQLVHTLKWLKINTSGELISPPKPEGFKQPYELVYIACHKERNLLGLKDLTMVDFLISIPSIIHSHKPPLVEWLKKFIPNGENLKGLEIFARYLQPQFTSIGLEVLKLMDKRLYETEDCGGVFKEN